MDRPPGLYPADCCGRDRIGRRRARVAARARRPPRPASRYVHFAALRFVGWVLHSPVLVCLCGILGFIGLLCWVALVALAIDAYMRRRRSQQYGVLWLMAICAERSIPVGPALMAFAREASGRLARRVRWFAALLEQGVPLADACREAHRIFPPEALPLVALGSQTGTLPAALRRAASQRRYHEEVLQNLTGKLAYLIFAPGIGPLILVFLMLKIIPSYDKIFRDFGMTLPPLTQWLIDTSRAVSSFGFLFALGELAIVLLFFYVLARCIGLLHWDMPGTEWMTRRLHAATVLDGLSVAVEHGVPMLAALGCLGADFPRPDIRWRLSRALRQIEMGGDWCEALRAVGLLNAGDMALLQAAQRVGNLPWALGELADSIRRRFAYRYHAILQTTFPLFVVLCGAAVLVIVTAFFIPMISLIQKMI